MFISCSRIPFLGICLQEQLAASELEIPDLEGLVRDDKGSPMFTVESHGLQFTNQMTLLKELRNSGVGVPQGPILDVGCGDGLFFAIAPYVLFPFIGRRKIIGLDLEQHKVEKSRRIASIVSESYRIGTVQERQAVKDRYTEGRSLQAVRVNEGFSLTYKILDPIDVSDMKNRDVDHVSSIIQKEGLMAMIWSNSMLHWIRDIENKYKAFDYFHALLKKGGVLCISMSAGGTASDFLQAYNNVVVNQLKRYHPESNPQGYRSRAFQPDPIGRKPVDEIAEMIEESGFNIIGLPRELGEPMSYHDPLQYVRSVQIYGRKNFERPFPHYTGTQRKEFWEKLEQEFLAILRAKGWKDGEPWIYRQFNNYVIAQNVTTANPEEEKGSRIANYLNQEFLELVYKGILQTGNKPIAIELSGNKSELQDAKVPINLDSILQPVLKYAAKECCKEPNPVCVINYSVGVDKRMTLTIEAKLNNPAPINEIFKFKTLAIMQKADVRVSDHFDGNTAKYEFNIPILQ